MRFFLSLSVLALLSFASACAPEAEAPADQVMPEMYPTTGEIERLDPALDDLIPADARIEILAEGYDWSEGPVWVADGEFLLFSDVPANTIHYWKEGEDARPWLSPSGFTGEGDGGREPGSNGLTLDAEGRLVLAQHGNRQVARLDAPFDNPTPTFTTLIDEWDGKQFNSPNDLVYHSNGSLYFTDPPYGLSGGVDDPTKEIPFQGVYRLDPDGTVTLLTDEITRPNGIALSPDEQTLYVAVSDPDGAVVMAYDVQDDGSVANGRILFDASPLMSEDRRGLPDGLKVDTEGNLWTTGPGGVLVISPEGQHLGSILTGEATANCAFGNDGSTLYMTADMYLMRIKVNATGTGF